MKILKLLAPAAALALTVGTAHASLITVTLPEFSGDVFAFGDPFPQPTVFVGFFSYSIAPGEEVVAASISGTFGNSVTPSSAGVDLSFGGEPVASCAPFFIGTTDPCSSADTLVPTGWSHIFPSADLPTLTTFTGPWAFAAIQTSPYEIRLGETTLTLETAPIAPVPEPGSMILLGAGLACLAALRLRAA